MKLVLRGSALLVILAGLATTLPAQDTKEPTKTDTTKPQTREKIESSGVLTGTLLKLDETTKDMTVRVKYMEADPAKVADNTNFYNRRVSEISRVRNLGDRQRQVQQLQIDMANRNRNAYRTKTKDYDITADDKLIVRVAQLPAQIDENGKPKKLSKQELKDLKGDPKLPGYKSDFNELRKDQYVQVYLAKKKATTTKDKKEAAKVDENEVPPSNRLKAIMIVIQQESAPK
jgi:hypothetical protein